MLAPDSSELADLAAGWRSAYVHIPFCRRRCPYCDFAVVTPDEAPDGTSIDSYVDALLAEIDMEPAWEPLHAINFGGGTPTTLEPTVLARVVAALHDRFGVDSDAEISVEANPEDITPGLLDRLLAVGVNRLSLGVQSFDDDVLRYLGRSHNSHEAHAAVIAAHRSTMPSVSIDLIYGAPGETAASWQATVDRALSLEPHHLSAYALTVERGTELSRSVLAGAAAPDPDDQADKYEAIVEAAATTDLVHYEISNFARTGHTVRYNLGTWAQGEYVAFGLGAHGHRNGIRRRNVRRLDVYLDRIARGERTEAGSEQLDRWPREQERLILGMCRRSGVIAGEAGAALVASEAGQRLIAAGVLTQQVDRLVVLRPLLTDAVNRAVISLEEPW